MNRPARVLAALALACVLAGALLSTRPSWAGWRDLLKKGVKSVTQDRESSRGRDKARAHAAVRGLGEDEGSGEDGELRDYESLESLAISAAEVDEFIREGRLAR